MFIQTIQSCLLSAPECLRSMGVIWVAVVGLSSAYILWYLWTFRLAPLIRPDEPKPLPYLVPCECYLSSPDIKIKQLTADHSHW